MLAGRVAAQTKPAGVAQAMEDIAAKLRQEISSSFTKTYHLEVTYGAYVLHADWGPSTRNPKEFKGEITCSKDSTRVDGEMSFDVFPISGAPTFYMLKEQKPEIDGGKLCAEVGYVENSSKKSGVGSACVYMLTLIAEKHNAHYIMISSSIVDQFYEKVGCETFDDRCNDLFGLTPTVKTQAQSHMK